jgi:hypothetical protein
LQCVEKVLSSLGVAAFFANQLEQFMAFKCVIDQVLLLSVLEDVLDSVKHSTNEFLSILLHTAVQGLAVVVLEGECEF